MNDGQQDELGKAILVYSLVVLAIVLVFCAWEFLSSGMGLLEFLQHR